MEYIEGRLLKDVSSDDVAGKVVQETGRVCSKVAFKRHHAW